ncbi:MAG: N-acetyltransferase [Nitrospirae bacterium]|nr:N-acetyltransferase [Nitrospirota bacterium]
MLEVLPANDKRSFREFIKFPFRLYSADPLWVPPLISDVKKQFSPENPFFRHAEVMPFIARNNNETVGRITAIYNRRHVEYHDETAGFFGYFECVDDNAVAAGLLKKAGQWLGERGMTVMRGPMNFSINEECGLLIEGFDEPPMIMMPYNFSYYQRLFEGCGLAKAKDLYAYVADVMKTFHEKVYRVAQVAARQGIKARPLNMKHFDEEMKVFKDIYESAWEKNWGHIPMTDEEIGHMAEKLRPVIVPDLALIAECNGEPVGFMMFLPDFNYVLKKLNGRLFPFGIFKALRHSGKIKDARLLLLGIKEGYRRRGVDSLLFIEGLKALHKKGYRRMEYSWVLEDNYAVQRIIETMNGRLYKKYRIYERGI